MNLFTAYRVWIAIVLAAFVVAPNARAAEAEAECRTLTFRANTSMLSTIRGADGKPRAAVSIFPGETLCLTGVESGAPRIVANAPRSAAVELRLKATQDRTTLELRFDFPGELEYTIGLPAGGTTDIIVGERGSATPGAPQVYEWPQRISRVVLFDFLSFPPLAARPTAILGEHNFLAVNFVSTLQFTSVDELNAEFARNGFSRVSGLQPYLGFGFDASFAGFRPTLDCNLGLERAGRGARAPGVDQVLIALNFGYAVYRREGIELFPMLGITGGDIGVDVRAENPALAVEGLVAAEQRIRRNVSLLLLSFGAHFPPWDLA